MITDIYYISLHKKKPWNWFENGRKLIQLNHWLMSFSIWTSSWIGYRKSTEKWQLKAGRANKSNARRTRPRKTKEMGSIKRRIAAVRMIEMDGWAPFSQMVDAGGPLTNWHEQHMPMMAALPTVTPASKSRNRFSTSNWYQQIKKIPRPKIVWKIGNHMTIKTWFTFPCY